MNISKLDIEQRVNLSLLINRYVRAMQKSHEADKECYEAQEAARAAFGRDSKVVASVNYQHYLVTTSGSGELTVEPIELI